MQQYYPATSKDIAEVMAEIRAVRQRLDELAPAPQWISVAEYMERKKVSKSTVYRKIEAGELQARGSGKTREVKV